MDKQTIVLEVNTVMTCDDGSRIFPGPKNIANELNRQIAKLLNVGEYSTRFPYGIGNILQVDLDNGIGLTIDVVREAVREVCRIFKDTAGVEKDVLTVNNVNTHVTIVAKDHVDAPCDDVPGFGWSKDTEELRDIKVGDF